MNPYYLLFCLNIIQVLECLGGVTNIIIDENGHDEIKCLRGFPLKCKSLQYVFNLSYKLVNDTKVTLNGGEHFLSGTTRISIAHFTLTSDHSAVVKCAENGNTGVIFQNSSNVAIEGLRFEDCGTSLSDGETSLNFAIYFSTTFNIRIFNSMFVRSRGAAVGMVDVTGNVRVSETNFIGNYTKSTTEEMGRTARGLYISSTQVSSEKESQINIHRCNFSRNYAEGSYSTYVFPEQKINDSVPLGKGAGININLDSRKFDVSVTDCSFFGNSAIWGAAFFAHLGSWSESNSLSVINCIFHDNSAAIGGGGVRITRRVCEKNVTKSKGNTVNLDKLSFVNNSAIWGGGLSLSLTTDTTYLLKTENRNISISNCNFTNNYATVGFAIGMDTLDENRYAIGTAVYRVNIANSTFERNYMAFTEDELSIGQGAIYAEEVSIHFIGSNTFHENNYTAVCLDSSTITFSKWSETLFRSNRGTEGGALSLYGFSWLLLEERSNVTFLNNKAERQGGAIFVRNPGPPRVAFLTTQLQIAFCFLRYENSSISPDDWPVHVNFWNNEAPDFTGSSIYATTLKYCRGKGVEYRNQSTAFNWTPISFNRTANYSLNKRTYEIVTDAVQLKVNDQLIVRPGMPFNASVTLLDERQQHVYATLRLKLTGAKLEPDNDVFLVRHRLKELRIVKKNSTSDTFSYRLYTQHGTAISTDNKTVTFKKCDPGFELDETNTKCKCMRNQHNDVLRCYDNGTVYIMKGKWGYVDENNRLVTLECPRHYCKCLDEVDGYMCRFNISDQCENNRNGTLCSQCKENFSVPWGNEDCTKCTNSSIGYLVLILFILTLLSGIIFRLNIDVFSGQFNALLYCYQIIMHLVPENVQANLDRFISFVIGILNMSGTGGTGGFCVYDGLDNLDKLFLNYLPPFWVVLCTVAFGLMSQTLWNRIFCFGCCRELESEDRQRESRRYSFGRAISFVCVLCYSSFTTTTLKLLHFQPFNGGMVVFDAGYQPFLEGRHLCYFIIALVFLVVVVIGFPLLLLFTHFINLRTVHYLQPIFDALKNNFRENWWSRSFAAYYFICRLIILAVNVFIRDELLRLLILAILCVLFQSILAASHPYKSSEFNYWDIFQLTDMCVISLLSLILNVPYVTTRDVREYLRYFIMLLIYLPLIVGVIRLFKIVYDRCVGEDPPSAINGSTQGQWKQRLGTFGNRFKDTGKGYYEKLIDRGSNRGEVAYRGGGISAAPFPDRATRYDIDD